MFKATLKFICFARCAEQVMKGKKMIREEAIAVKEL